MNSLESVSVPKLPKTTNKANIRLMEIKHEKEKLSQKLQNLSFAEELIEKEIDNDLQKSPHSSKTIKDVKRPKSKSLEREELHQKQASALELVLKLQSEKRERERKRILEHQKYEEMVKQEVENDAKRIKEKQDERLKKIKEEAMQKHLFIKEQRKKDIEELKNHQKRILKIPENERLYKRFEEKYEKEILMPILEQKKQELAKKRGENKKLDFNELNEHQKKFNTIIQERQEKWKQELMRKKQEEKLIKSHQKEMHSSIMENIQKAYEEMRARDLEKQQKRKNYHEKMTNYASLIKELKPVTIDELKAAELKKQIETLKHPVRQKKDRKELMEKYDLSKIRFLKTPGHATRVNRSLIAEHTKRENDSNNVDAFANDQSESAGCDTKRVESRKKLNMIRYRYKHDYLEEFRKKRSTINTIDRPFNYNWEADIKDDRLTEVEKCEKIIEKAELIEKNAKMKEKVLELKGGAVKNYELGEFVSDMFLDAIKAKLAVLENL